MDFSRGIRTGSTIYQALTTAIETKASVEEIREWLAKDVSLESVLADLIQEKFTDHLPRLAHFCKDGTPVFYPQEFQQGMESLQVNATKPEDIKVALLPLLTRTVGMPGATCPEEDYVPVLNLILDEALDALWQRVARHAELARQTLLEQNVAVHSRDITLLTKGTKSSTGAGVRSRRGVGDMPRQARLDAVGARSEWAAD